MMWLVILSSKILFPYLIFPVGSFDFVQLAVMGGLDVVGFESVLEHLVPYWKP